MLGFSILYHLSIKKILGEMEMCPLILISP